MITWISSYPRSGNTLLRIMFKDVFGVVTPTKYDGRKSIIAALLGTPDHDEPWPEMRDRLRADASMHFVKTHDAPESAEEACIYVVRDPAAAIVSYRHYLRDINDLDLPLPVVAMGLCPYGSWSDHVKAWAPMTRPKTLLLRFEDLTANPHQCIEQIADFTGLTPTGTWNGDINRLKPTDGAFFRSGSNQRNREELTTLEQLLISAQHGMTAKNLGYTTAEVTAAEAQSIQATVTHLMSDIGRLRQIVNDREVVISGLQQACQERLELIHRFHAALNPS